MPVLINMKSIQDAAKKVINGREFKKEQQECVQEALLGHISLDIAKGSLHTASEAAEKFIDVLKNHISTSGLSSNAAGAISDFSCGTPVCAGDKCTIKVSFAGNMHRESLATTLRNCSTKASVIQCVRSMVNGTGGRSAAKQQSMAHIS